MIIHPTYATHSHCKLISMHLLDTDSESNTVLRPWGIRGKFDKASAFRKLWVEPGSQRWSRKQAMLSLVMKSPSLTAALQAPLSSTTLQSLLRLMSIQSMMPSNHLILCHPFLLLPSFFPSLRVSSNESALWTKWAKYCSFSFSISPSRDGRWKFSIIQIILLSLDYVTCHYFTSVILFLLYTNIVELFLYFNTNQTSCKDDLFQLCLTLHSQVP